MFNDNPIAEIRGPWGVPIQFGASLMILPLFILVNGLSLANLLFGALFIAILILTIVLHELGHAWGCHVLGIPLRRIMITGGGGFCEQARSATRSQDELIVAMGPIVNIVIWAVGSLVLNHYGYSLPQFLGTILALLAWFNFYIALFNMLPVLPLDGGKLLNLVLLRLMPKRAAARVTGTVGIAAIVLWIPMMYYSWKYFGFVLLFFPPIGIHWQMMKGERL